MYLKDEKGTLYYEVRGEGEPLLLIHGLIVDADLFARAAELLAGHFRVITYDRRGNSRSAEGAQDFSMESQIEDIRALLDVLRIECAYMAGVSAGAVIGQYFLQTWPGRVKHLIMYEPAMLGEMMDNPEVSQWVEQMGQLVEKRKFSSAVLRFAQHIGMPDERRPPKDMEVSFREMGNHEHALTREFPALIAYRPDLEKMREQAGKITLAAGEKSGTSVYVSAAVSLGEAIGKKAIFYPGGHNLPFELPREFALCVLGTLLLSEVL